MAEYDAPDFMADTPAGRFDARSGAPMGTAGISAGNTSGAVIGSPVVSAPYGSSQLPANRPTVDVRSGDTSGFSDDTPVHTSPLLPGPLDDYLGAAAGAQTSHVTHGQRYPWQSPDGA